MSRMNRTLRWLLLIAAGCILFQTTAQCTFNEGLQTVILAGIGGGVYYLARNV
jgi:hypothetical protein